MTNTSNLVIVADVETTGLIPKTPTDISFMPRILQLSYLIYDLTTGSVVKTYDTYINVSPSVEISTEISGLTGITRELCEERGISIVSAIAEFYDDYLKCGIFVCHNIEFDRGMIQIEIERNRSELTELCPFVSKMFTRDFQIDHGIKNYCTMEKSRAVCKLVRLSKYGKEYYKSPRLSELHFHLFGTIPENMHNSFVDVTATLRCFMGLYSV